MTGPSPATRQAVYARAGNRCELCNTATGPFSVHHRRPRGMGGSKDPVTNAVSSLLLVCGSGTTGCHGALEQNRTDALSRGWLVPQGQDPAYVPVLLARGLTFLTADGGYRDLFDGAA